MRLGLRRNLRLSIKSVEVALEQDEDSPINMVLDNENFVLPKQYSLQRIIEMGTFGVTW